MYSVIGIFVVFSLFCGWIWIKGYRARKLLAGLACYPSLPVVGNALQLLGDTEHVFHLIVNMSKISNDESKPFVVWLGPWQFIGFNDVGDIKTVSSTFLDKPFLYKYSEDYIGNGLITAPGSVWKSNIKKLAGTFTNVTNLETYQQNFTAKAQILVEKLKAEAVNSPVNIFHVLDHISLLAILDIAVGQRIHEDVEIYTKASTRTLRSLIERGINPLLSIDWIYKLTPTYKEVNKCVNFLNNYATKVIAERKRERDAMVKDHVVTQGKLYIDNLLDLHEVDSTFSLRQMISELNTVIVAGQGTLAITLTIIFITLGKRADIQEKLHAEMKEMFGDSKRKPNADDLKNMSYCDAVINEALRLYPPVPIVLRHADCDLKLQSCTVPKGTVCGFNLWAAGRSKKSWGADAEEFRPERWLEDGCPIESSIPFSIGKRSCIGKKYAISVMKIILAQCIREFIITSHSSKLRLRMDVALKVIEGDLIKVKLRK